MHASLIVLALGIGVIAGLRAMTPPMLVSWAAHLHWINLGSSHLAFMSTAAAVVIFSLLALGELINDKLPKTGARTALPSVIVRMLTGAFAASAFCVGAGASAVTGIIFGIVGALIGTFGGYQARTGAVRASHLPDWVIALVEDLIAVGGGFLLALRF